MDLAFIRRRTALQGKSAAQLDFGVLVATLEAQQSLSAGAKAEVRAAADVRAAGLGCEPIVELVLGGGRWRDAIVSQGGSFSAALAQSRGNAS